MPRAAKKVATGRRASVGRQAVRRQDRVQTRAKACQTRVVPLGLSYLESVTVAPSTLVDYRRRLNGFLMWAQKHKLDWTTYPVLDELLCEFFDQRFFEGWTSDEGGKVLAALGYFIPELHKNVGSMLPRASRALRGWTKLGPAEQRLPLPWVLQAVIMANLIHRGCVAHAACLVIQHNAYLRPGEAVSLTVKQ